MSKYVCIANQTIKIYFLDRYVILGIKAMTDTMNACRDQLDTFVDHYLETLENILAEEQNLQVIENVIISV